jgi:SAM-dependent methyltransferase
MVEHPGYGYTSVNKSSSDHSLNADRPLTKVQRLQWLYLNWRNNRRPQQELDERLKQCVFPSAGHLAPWEQIDTLVSPARRLCDLFWLAMPWPRITAALGAPVRLLEVGCGTGRYGTLLRDRLGTDFGSYTGLDVVADPAWSSLATDPRFVFHGDGAADVTPYLSDANLVFTQSAIEHFDTDLDFMRQIARHLESRRTPLLQVHLMPSAGGLRTFMWHGVRNYTPRTISRMTRLFGDDTQRVLYSLGSARCNRTHRRRITYPWLFGRPDGRRGDPAGYDRELRHAVEQDARHPVVNHACFYALVLAHGLPPDLFECWQETCAG